MLIIRVKALVKNAKGVKTKALVKGAKRCVKGIGEECLRIKSSGISEECQGRYTHTDSLFPRMVISLMVL